MLFNVQIHRYTAVLRSLEKTEQCPAHPRQARSPQKSLIIPAVGSVKIYSTLNQKLHGFGGSVPTLFTVRVAPGEPGETRPVKLRDVLQEKLCPFSLAVTYPCVRPRIFIFCHVNVEDVVELTLFDTFTTERNSPEDTSTTNDLSTK